MRRNSGGLIGTSAPELEQVNDWVPAGNKALNYQAYDVRNDPVERETAGEVQCEEAEHCRHHPQHHSIGGRLSLVSSWHGSHFLHDPHGRTDQDWHHKWCRVRPGKIHPQEIAVDGYYAIDLRKPVVQVSRQADETLRVGWNSLNNRLVQPDPYRELNEHWSQAAKRVNTLLTIQLHRLLGRALPVAFVLVLDLLHHGLESAHRLYLAALLHRERNHHDPHQQSKGDNRDAKVREQVVIEQDQSIDHRLDDHEVPGV